jgi:hypothetical protein
MRSLVALYLVALFPASAHGGRTHFGWLYGTTTLPQRTVELETWFLEESGKGDDQLDEALLWWGPVLGLTDEVELAVPVEVGWREVPFDAPETEIERFGAEMRWRLVPSDPVEAGALAPLVRFGVKRVVPRRGIYQTEADAVLSYDLGRIHVALDLGAIARIGEGVYVELRPGAGTSVRVFRELRLGAEAYAEIGLREESSTWVTAGPNLSWALGRFWIAASAPVGLRGIDIAPRVNMAIAF